MRRWRLALHRRLIINLKTGSAVAGVFWEERRGIIVLKSPELIREDGSRVAMDGELLIDSANIDYAQDVTVTGTPDRPPSVVRGMADER